jgi:hypothetical protein
MSYRLKCVQDGMEGMYYGQSDKPMWTSNKDEALVIDDSEKDYWLKVLMVELEDAS